MEERTEQANLDDWMGLEKILKSVPVTVKPLELPDFSLGNSSLGDYNPKEFSITVSETNSCPVILLNSADKTAKAYPQKYLQQRWSAYDKEKAKRLRGTYRETLNALRRHDYSIRFSEVLGPQDLQIIT